MMAEFLCGLPPDLVAKVEKGHMTNPEDIILAPVRILLLQECTENDIKVLKKAAAAIVGEKPVKVSELLKRPSSLKWARVTFACAALDIVMRGGVLTRGITEICGSSGSGKTQLLLQLSLAVQLPTQLGGLARGAVFICTEDTFPSKRLHQMSKSFQYRYPEQNINYLGNIYVEHVIESDDLLKCVGDRLSKLLNSANIGLIVIDSVAAVFRVYSDYVKRAQEMRRLANYLLLYAEKYSCAVVCVNQVTSVSEEAPDVPCLGLVWAHLGRTRIRISKIPKQIMVQKQLLTIRKFEIMYSPETPNDTAEFLITEHGVVDVP